MSTAITKSMSAITAVVLAVFVGYGASWYFGLVDGNFSLLLFLAAVVTGIYWLAERFYFLPQRYKQVEALEIATSKRHAELAEKGITKVDTDIHEAKTRLIMQPWWLDWTAGLHDEAGFGLVDICIDFGDAFFSQFCMAFAGCRF